MMNPGDFLSHLLFCSAFFSPLLIVAVLFSWNMKDSRLAPDPERDRWNCKAGIIVCVGLYVVLVSATSVFSFHFGWMGPAR